MKFLISSMVIVGCAVGLAALPPDDDPPQFTPWSAAENLGAVVNSPSYDGCPTISKNALSLFFRSNRDGSAGFDIWVAQRDSLEDPWQTPVNLGPTINSPSDELCSALTPDEHWMVFVSTRPGGLGGQDLWASHRQDKRDDFGWEPPVNLGSGVNSIANDNGPAIVEDEATGQLLLYFSSNRAGGKGFMDIYVKDASGPPVLVPELSSAFNDQQPTLRKDGLEIIFASNRTGTLGSGDLWASTRESTLDLWPTPVNLGSLVNSTVTDFRPALSRDATMLFFASERAGGHGGPGDLYMCTRSKLKGKR